jgi:hypothetical protein
MSKANRKVSFESSLIHRLLEKNHPSMGDRGQKSDQSAAATAAGTGGARVTVIARNDRTLHDALQ